MEIKNFTNMDSKDILHAYYKKYHYHPYLVNTLLVILFIAMVICLEVLFNDSTMVLGSIL